jgi:hypothetical protein
MSILDDTDAESAIKDDTDAESAIKDDTDDKYLQEMIQTIEE